MKLQPNYSGAGRHVEAEYLVTRRVRNLLLSCIFLATAFNGLSGSGIDRVLIEMPAWQHVGATAWAALLNDTSPMR